MNRTTKRLLTAGTAIAFAVPMSSALALQDSVMIGGWLNYTYDNENDEVGGDIDFESVNLYLNHHPDDSDWFFDSEIRFGEGSFQTFSGGAGSDGKSAIGLKEFAVGYRFSDETTLRIGKVERPFAWARLNFWPGARQASGFDDSYHAGARVDFDPQGPLDYSFMFAKNQNFGSDTTSLDDGTFSFWGTEDGYRMINTGVFDVGYDMNHTRVGFSAMAGQLTNQADARIGGETIETEGDETESHYAVGLYTEGNYGGIDFNTKFIHYDLDQFTDPDDAVDDDFLTPGDGQVIGISAGYQAGSMYYLADLTRRMPDSDANGLGLVGESDGTDDTTDLVLGGIWNFGPGNVYTEVVFTNITEEDDPTGQFSGLQAGERNEQLQVTIDYYF